VSDKIYEYIYGELDKDASEQIEKHLGGCAVCRNKYIELKKLLIDDMAALNEVKNKIEVPPGLNLKIRRSIQPRRRWNFAKYTIAACIALTLLFTTPVLAYYIIQSTPLDKYVELDSGVTVDFEEGKGQLIQKSSTVHDITMTVDGMIRRKDRTTMLLTIKVPKDEQINYGVPLDGFNSLTVEDQFGVKYQPKGSVGTLKSVNEDGEAKFIYDIEPIGFWAYKLNLRITAIELGKYNDKSSIDIVKNSYGSWNVNFYVNRSRGGGLK
jgi:hypothetical protein